MNTFLITILITITSFSIYAQSTLNGVVKNKLGESIHYATVRIVNSSIGTATDSKGIFELKIPSENAIIEVSAIGYATKVLSTSTPQITIILSKSTETLDEIIVSAQKREESLINTPIAVTSLNAQKVKDTRTWDLSSLSALVPNYLYQELGVGFQQIQSIRGIQVFSENPAVATYIDEVNNLDILANGFILTDIERIEVLRGPQGTLFGRNTIGGVVTITTKKPKNITTGFVTLGLGNLNLNRHSIGIKTPIIKNKLFLGFNGLFQDRDGYWRNDTSLSMTPNLDANNKTVGDSKNLFGNFYLKWLTSDRFSVLLNLKAQKDWSNASSFFVSQPDEKTAFKNPDKIYLGKLASHERNIMNTSMVLKYNAPTVIINAITTYQNIGLSFRDIDFNDGTYYHSFAKTEFGEKLPKQEVWSQEFRINSINSSSKLNYTAGIYGFNQLAYEPSTNLALEPVTSQSSLLLGLPPNTSIINTNKGENYGTAVFGELSYKITEQLKVTTGIRYDYEKRKNTFNGYGDLLLSNGVLIENNSLLTKSNSYEALSPKFALSYAITDRSNIYASYNRGFRAGGINVLRLPEGIKQTFDPEYSNNFELGYKLNTLNNTLHLGIATFYIDWTDLQFFNQVSIGTFSRENVGDAKSMGVELEASAIPVKGLQIEASLGLTDTEYKDFILNRDKMTSLVPVTIEENKINISGNKLSNTPNHTLFFGAQYTSSISKKTKATLRGEIKNIGAYYTDIQNDLKQPSYTLINAKLGISFGKYELSLWGQNLTDQTYLSFGSSDTSFGRNVRTAAPVTYGTTLNIRF
ncbi:TonB-dependent receptor [Aquimarina longa]|uniref:TonB-dependent receptor n=1 Tax=Aquimarina longa TaxID=1080221 RepID=UPI000780A64D|nr:TonB-dependent receptor [Aquimarina longa]